MRPEELTGGEWKKAYTRVVPNPEDRSSLVARVQQLEELKS